MLQNLKLVLVISRLSGSDGSSSLRVIVSTVDDKVLATMES